MTTNKTKKILVFGTFDGLHQGHQFFLRKAKTKGDELIVSVARDAHVRLFKNKSPINHQEKRLNAVQMLKFVDRAVFSDEEPGTYGVIKTEEPDLILLGYDQQNLEEDLQRWMGEEGLYIPIQRLKQM